MKTTKLNHKITLFNNLQYNIHKQKYLYLYTNTTRDNGCKTQLLQKL